MKLAGGWSVLVMMCAGCVATTATGPVSSGTTAPPPTPPPTTSAATEPESPAPAPTASPSGGGELQLVTVPDVMGKHRDDAVQILERAGVKFHIDNDQGEDFFARATVCGETPGGGRQTRANLPVTIRFCDNTRRRVKARVELVGLTIEQAKKRAREAGFTERIEVVESTDSACAMGTVCDVSPEGWDLELGHLLKLYTPKKLDIKAPD